MVSIVILSFNTEKALSECLSSVFDFMNNLPFEVIIVDNNSTDGSVEMVKRTFPKAKLIENKENVGFAKGVNQGAGHASGTHLLLLNSDAKMHDRSFQDMLEFMKKSDDIAIIGGKLENSDGSTSKSYGKFYNLPEVIGMLFGRKEKEIDRSELPKKVDWVSGGYMLIKRDKFARLKGFDEHFFMYVEDMELCYRAAKQHIATWYYPAATMTHIGQGSSNRPFAIVQIYKGLLYFYKKHKSSLAYFILKVTLLVKSILAIMLGTLSRNADLIATYRKALRVLV